MVQLSLIRKFLSEVVQKRNSYENEALKMKINFVTSFLIFKNNERK